MQTIFYEDAAPTGPLPTSIFLAGPTLRGGVPTPWRQDALTWFKEKGFMGTVVVPEFRDWDAACAPCVSDLEDAVDVRFGRPPSPTPGMQSTTYNILAWETAGIENVTVVLFWMPFNVPRGEAGGPEFRPGYTTRAEVSREMMRDHTRIVLGMPERALSSGHIRYHAYRTGVPIYATLEETLTEALTRATAAPKSCLKCLRPYSNGNSIMCSTCIESNRL